MGDLTEILGVDTQALLAVQVTADGREGMQLLDCAGAPELYSVSGPILLVERNVVPAVLKHVP
jgi:hypothetical protein